MARCSRVITGSASDDVARVYGTHEFTIRHYSRITNRMRSGEPIVSQDFTVDDRAWRVEFYPQGCGGIFDWGWTALFVRTDTDLVTDPFHAEFVFQLLDPDVDGGGQILYEHRSDEAIKHDDSCNGWGTCRFMTRKQLETPDLGALRGDSLTVRFTVGVLKPHAKRSRVYDLPDLVEVRVPPSCYAGRNAVRFLKSGRAPFDVRFNVDGVVLEAHRLVLASQSPWFERLLYGPLSETTDGVVDIRDTSPGAFRGVLHYIYNDKLPDEATADEATTRELFLAAGMYLLDRLKMMCANRLCDFIGEGTVESITELAETHSCKELRQACQNYLDRTQIARLTGTSYKHINDVIIDMKTFKMARVNRASKMELIDYLYSYHFSS